MVGLSIAVIIKVNNTMNSNKSLSSRLYWWMAVAYMINIYFRAFLQVIDNSGISLECVVMMTHMYYIIDVCSI